MEFLFYFICGILYAEIIIISFFLLCVFIYWIYKFIFWFFDLLGIENPIMVAYEFVRDKLTL